MCFVFIWEQTATCATYSINWLVFITEMKSVYCAVRTASLNKAVCASYLKRYIAITCLLKFVFFYVIKKLLTSVYVLVTSFILYSDFIEPRKEMNIPQCAQSTTSSEPLLLSHALHCIIFQCVTASPWNQRLNFLYFVGVKSSTAVSLANMMHMNMKPKGHFNHTLHRGSRFVFVFDKRVYVFAFSSVPGNEGGTATNMMFWDCSVRGCGRPVHGKILHKRLFVLR